LKENVSRFNLECADKSALWNGATCRAVGKRRQAAALQINTPPSLTQIAREFSQIEKYDARLMIALHALINCAAHFKQAEGLPEGSRRLERERIPPVDGEMETTLKGSQKFVFPIFLPPFQGA